MKILLLKLCFLLLGIALVYSGFNENNASTLAVGAVVTICAALIFQRTFSSLRSRRYGVVLEEVAIKALLKARPTGWAIVGNVFVPGLGDADVLVTRSDKARFVIEIKSHQNVAVRRRFWIFGKKRLIRLDGQKWIKDPIAQALALAARVQAHPVVWFPGAPSLHGLVDQVTVIGGPAKAVLKAMKKNNDPIPT
jgi:hypothetical protein